jgi:hypothetical protein
MMLLLVSSLGKLDEYTAILKSTLTWIAFLGVGLSLRIIP